MLFNLTSVVNWRVVTAAKQQQVDIDNAQENARQVMHDYAISNRVYVEITGIYLKLNYRKQNRIESHNSLKTVQFESNRYK